MWYALELMCFTISHENRKAFVNDKKLEGQERVHDKKNESTAFLFYSVGPFLKQSHSEFLLSSLRTLTVS